MVRMWLQWLAYLNKKGGDKEGQRILKQLLEYVLSLCNSDTQITVTEALRLNY